MIFCPRYRKIIPKSILVSVVLLATLVILLPSQANASESKTFVVPANMVYQISFNFDRGTIFNGSVAVSGGSGTNADFIYCHIDRPAGSLDLFPYTFGSVKGIGYFDFVAPESTSYTVVFVNRDTTSRTVTLSYDINYPSNNTGGGNGMPLEILFGIIIALVIVLVIVLVYVASKKTGSKTKEKGQTNSES